MLRAILYSDNAIPHRETRDTIERERIYFNLNDWDLGGTMKVWFEYPESTRYARSSYDILYTPIFFANEGVSGHLCLEASESIASEILQLSAEVYVKGVATLGLMNIGGRPASLYDTRYSLPAIGFRPILTLEVLNIYDTLSLDANPYERNTVVGRRVPFSFPLPAENLHELQEFAPSLKSISSDTATTMDILKDMSPTMLLQVTYKLEAYLIKNDRAKQRIEQEIRIFVALDQDQIPCPIPSLDHEVHRTRRTSMVSIRKGSKMPSLLASRRKSVHEAGGGHIIVEAEDPDPFIFQTHSDAAATKLRVTLTYNNPDSPNESPGTVQANIEYMLRSLTTIAVTQNPRPEDSEVSEDAFHLRSKHLPFRKLKMKWDDWSRVGEDETPSESSRPWRSVQDLWLTEATKTCLTPTFRTSFLSHNYSISMAMSISAKSFKSRSYKLDLNVPVRVRYDIGLAPSYSIDHGLPGYSIDEQNERIAAAAQRSDRGDIADSGTQTPTQDTAIPRGPPPPLEPPTPYEEHDGDDIVEALNRLELQRRNTVV